MATEYFKSAVDKLRDILRLGKKSITGMDSMKHITIYLIHRYLTTEMCKKLKIPEELSWENIYNRCLENESYWATSLAHLSGKTEDSLIEQIDEIFGTRGYTFSIEDHNKHKEIMKIMNQIDIENVHLDIDLIGYLFEIHLKNAGSNKRDLGQFFTDRDITKFMVELCQPKINDDGLIETVCDPSMGSGGFLTSIVQYFNENYDDIEWKKQQQQIYGCDVDEFITALTKINLLFESKGTLFNNIQLRDSLSEDLMLTEYDIILANEPFGLKGLKHADMCDRVKNLKIRGTKSEPLFLQLIMLSLAENGRCAVIVPDGVLFDSSIIAKGTRKYLLENFNLKRIIKMEGKFFMNTGLEPSILYFVRDGRKTKKIRFTKIVKEDDELIESKIITVGVDQLDSNYSLNYKLFLPVERSIKTGLPMAKLGDILKQIKGPTHNVGEGKPEGKYPLVCSSKDKKLYLDSYDYEDLALIIGTGGNPNVHLKEKFNISTHSNVYHSKSDDVLIQYVYYYLLLNLNIFEPHFNGSTIRNITKVAVDNIEIPIPSIETQEAIIAELDPLYSTYKILIQRRDIIQRGLNRLHPGYDCEEVNLTDLIIDKKYPKHPTNFGSTNGLYRFHTGAESTKLFVEKYDIEDLIIIINRTNGSGKCHIYLDRNCSVASQTIILLCEDDEKTKYLYHYLKNNINLLEQHYKGSSHKNISKEDLKKIVILVPPVEKQEEFISKCEEFEKIIESYNEHIEKNEWVATQILQSYL